MVTKVSKSGSTKTTSAAPKGSAQFADSIRDSAQQIWQAGLGAFAKAQEGRGKVFDALVQEGLAMQRKTQAAAEERINAATSKVTDMANDITAKASGQWDKLESIFEERVAKALKRLGLPSAQELAEMKAQLDALSQQVGSLTKQAKAKGKSPVESSASATPAKQAVKRVSAKAATKAPAQPATKPESKAKSAIAPEPAAPTSSADSAPARTTASGKKASRAKKASAKSGE